MIAKSFLPRALACLLLFASPLLGSGLRSLPVYDIGDPSEMEVLLLESLNDWRAAPYEYSRKAYEFTRLIGGTSVSLLYAPYVDLDVFLEEMKVFEPVTPVVFNRELNQAADKYLNEEVVPYRKLSHYGIVKPSKPWSRAAEAGYNNGDPSPISESMGWVNVIEPMWKRAIRIIGLFMVDPGDSPETRDEWGMQPERGHRNMLLHGLVYEVGIGDVVATWQENSTDDGDWIDILGGNRGLDQTRFVGGVCFSDADGDNSLDQGESLKDVEIFLDGAAFRAVSSTYGAFTIPLPEEEVPNFISFHHPSFGWASKRIERESPDWNIRVQFNTATFQHHRDKENFDNLSTRGLVSSGAPMIGGVVVEGDSPRSVFVVAIGPGLSGCGVNDYLRKPILTLVDSATGAVVTPDATYESSPEAFPPVTLVDEKGRGLSGESNVGHIYNLAPGHYTAVVSTEEGESGVCLLATYDRNESAETDSGKVINLSTRGNYVPGSPVIIGLHVPGSHPRRVLFRGVGASVNSLDGLHIPDAIEDTYLKVFDEDGKLIAESYDWRSEGDVALIEQASSLAGAFPLADDSREGALVAWLEPGIYTVMVGSEDSIPGTVLVEAYDAPPADSPN